MRSTAGWWTRESESHIFIAKTAALPLPRPCFCRYTIRMKSSDLVYIQRIIIACVRENPGCFNRSELAKLLVGSRALEIAKWEGSRWHNQLRGMTRKSVTGDVDILLQQGYLALDSRQKVVLEEKEGQN